MKTICTRFTLFAMLQLFFLLQPFQIDAQVASKAVDGALAQIQEATLRGLGEYLPSSLARGVAEKTQTIFAYAVTLGRYQGWRSTIQEDSGFKGRLIGPNHGGTPNKSLMQKTVSELLEELLEEGFINRSETDLLTTSLSDGGAYDRQVSNVILDKVDAVLKELPYSGNSSSLVLATVICTIGSAPRILYESESRKQDFEPIRMLEALRATLGVMDRLLMHNKGTQGGLDTRNYFLSLAVKRGSQRPNANELDSRLYRMLVGMMRQIQIVFFNNYHQLTENQRIANFMMMESIIGHINSMWRHLSFEDIQQLSPEYLEFETSGGLALPADLPIAQLTMEYPE